MRIIDRYMLSVMLSSTALILLVLIGLGAFINFAGQVDNVGEGSYTLLGALTFVALNLPQQAYVMLPVAALLGTLLGLGGLASSSELTVLRASGVSIWRLARSVSIGALVLTVLAAALGEFIAPPAEQYAKRFRAQQMHKQLSFAGGQSGWIKDGNVIVNIGEFLSGEGDGGVRIYRFDDTGRLHSVGAASMADVSADHKWQLEDYRESTFGDDGVRTRKQRLATQNSDLSPDLLRLSVIDPDQLSGRRLARYVSYLKANGLKSDRYEIAAWSRVSNVLAVFLMCLLALPFVFGSLRSAGGGARIVVGVLFGVAYFLGSKTLANSGAVYGIEPALTAFLPALVLATITTLLLARVR